VQELLGVGKTTLPQAGGSALRAGPGAPAATRRDPSLAFSTLLNARVS
jgi:hypothetical protein